MELTEVLLGFLLITVGLSSTALAASYWRANGPTLFSFGVFTLLYGTRLMLTADLLAPSITLTARQSGLAVWTISYWLPVPGIIYLERSRKRSGPLLHRLWQGWIAVAVGFTLYDLTVGPPGSASYAYAIAVIPMVLALVVHVVGWKASPTLDLRIGRIGLGGA